MKKLFTFNPFDKNLKVSEEIVLTKVYIEKSTVSIYSLQ